MCPALKAVVPQDDGVDELIAGWLCGEEPTSFFLFAGAGSGKTRTLVYALDRVRAQRGRSLRLHGKRVAVITYTNAACDEIIGRLDFDPLVHVSTIHSFVWSLIKGFDDDIRDWLQAALVLEIEETAKLLQKGRPGTKAAMDRQRSIEATTKRLRSLPQIRRFVYSPTGDNRSRGSLSHSEVIKIGADFLMSKPVMQSILVDGYPILLIDESQDTNRLLMDAVLGVQTANPKRLAVGLFGDMMQRIYGDGKADLGVNLPSSWKTPAKLVNFRCPRRVVRLINKVRSEVDDHVQVARSGAEEGHVRLFLAPGGLSEKADVESRVRERMAALTGDIAWSRAQEVKTLILEHHMAAKRMGFGEMWEALYRVEELRTGLRDGTLPCVRLFSEIVLPLVVAKRAAREFDVAAIVRGHSPLLGAAALQSAGASQELQLAKANDAVELLAALWTSGQRPTFLDMLHCVASTGVFEIPTQLLPFAVQDTLPCKESPKGDELDEGDVLDGLRKFLETPFEQVAEYAAYVRGDGRFATHQGVKGLEFPRVLVVLDDEEAGGFLFSYDKFLGAKEKSTTDAENERSGKETSLDRTRRLFYVTCSRAKEGVAVLVYSQNREGIRAHAVGQGWFDPNEIEMM